MDSKSQIDAEPRAGAKNIEFFSPGAFTKRRRSDVSTSFVDFCFSCKGCDVPHVPRLSAKTGVRPVAQRVASLARCNLEKRRKSLPKSTQNRRKSRLGAARAPVSVDLCRSKRAGRAIRGESGRVGPVERASQGAQAGRAGTRP